MPDGKKIVSVLLDSEYYTNEVIEYLEAKRVSWAIAADKDSAVKKAVMAIPEARWNPFRNKEGVTTDREVAETVHACYQ